MSSSGTSTASASSAKRRILLVDHHPVVRESLTKQINKEEDLVVCFEAGSPADALKAIDEHHPDVLIIELAQVAGDALEMVKNFRSRYNSLPIVAFTTLEESSHALRFLQAGVQGYVMKTEPFERLLGAIHTVLNGGFAVSPETSTRFLQTVLNPSTSPSTSAIDRLGGRELEVFTLLGKGLGTREIAVQLDCSTKTIETYRARIKEKLRLPDATALVREAVRWMESQR